MSPFARIMLFALALAAAVAYGIWRLVRWAA
jgi:hypothetical protein